MKKLIVLSVIFILVVPLRATTYIVDQNGGGQFTTIQPAIQAANPGDTVKVWPGYYTEQVNFLNKDITLMGSGYENTLIAGTANPMVIMGIGSGRLQWFQITSTGGIGIVLSGGTVKNCVIANSSSHGIIGTLAGTSQVINCVLYQNGGWGVYVNYLNSTTVNVTNCISRENGGGGFYDYYGTLNLSYSNGTKSGTIGNIGWVNCDPVFTDPPYDFHIGPASCSWNTGNPSLFDPDGSRSDMGYFGGPDCPIYPVVVQILIEPNGNGNINLTAKARANY